MSQSTAYHSQQHTIVNNMPQSTTHHQHATFNTIPVNSMPQSTTHCSQQYTTVNNTPPIYHSQQHATVNNTPPAHHSKKTTTTHYQNTTVNTTPQSTTLTACFGTNGFLRHENTMKDRPELKGRSPACPRDGTSNTVACPNCKKAAYSVDSCNCNWLLNTERS